MHTSPDTFTAMAAVLDALSAAVFAVDRKLLLVHANRAGRAMLERADPVRLAGGRIAFADRAASAAASAAVAGGQGASFSLAFKSGEACVAHVCALGAPGSGTSAIFIAPAQASESLAGDRAAPIYSLTPAEGRVFSLIAAGHAPSGVARNLGIAKGTVRTHLLRVFQKTGCKRQAEIVRLGAQLAAPF
jgi:DNA-binding CsgD family transcriptional regulator